MTVRRATGGFLVLLSVGMFAFGACAQTAANAAVEPDGLQMLSARETVPFVVGGVSRDFKDDDWNDQVIAEGIRNLLVDEFKANPRFTNVEDNPEIRDSIKQFVASTWFGKAQPDDIGSVDKGVTPDQLVITARLTNFSKKRVSSFGFGMNAATVTIGVTVVLDFTLDGKKIYEAAGAGSGKTEQDSVLFQISNDQITFDATTIGTAVRKAVHNAVVQSMGAFHS
jgi:hypothetical protein